MLSSQYDAGRSLSDTTSKLRRVQQLRKLLEAEGDFPTSGAGIKLEQVARSCCLVNSMHSRQTVEPPLAQAKLSTFILWLIFAGEACS